MYRIYIYIYNLVLKHSRYIHLPCDFFFPYTKRLQSQTNVAVTSINPLDINVPTKKTRHGTSPSRAKKQKWNWWVSNGLPVSNLPKQTIFLQSIIKHIPFQDMTVLIPFALHSAQMHKLHRLTIQAVSQQQQTDTVPMLSSCKTNLTNIVLFQFLICTQTTSAIRLGHTTE